MVFYFPDLEGAKGEKKKKRVPTHPVEWKNY